MSPLATIPFAHIGRAPTPRACLLCVSVSALSFPCQLRSLSWLSADHQGGRRHRRLCTKKLTGVRHRLHRPRAAGPTVSLPSSSSSSFSFILSFFPSFFLQSGVVSVRHCRAHCFLAQQTELPCHSNDDLLQRNNKQQKQQTTQIKRHPTPTHSPAAPPQLSTQTKHSPHTGLGARTRTPSGTQKLEQLHKQLLVKNSAGTTPTPLELFGLKQCFAFLFEGGLSCRLF